MKGKVLKSFDPYAARRKAECAAKRRADYLADCEARRVSTREAEGLAESGCLARLEALGFFSATGDPSKVLKEEVLGGPWPYVFGQRDAEIPCLWVSRGIPDLAHEFAVCVSGAARDVGAWLLQRPQLWSMARNGLVVMARNGLL